MSEARIRVKNQITVPPDVLETLNAREGDILDFDVLRGHDGANSVILSKSSRNAVEVHVRLLDYLLITGRPGVGRTRFIREAFHKRVEAGEEGLLVRDERDRYSLPPEPAFYVKQNDREGSLADIIAKLEIDKLPPVLMFDLSSAADEYNYGALQEAYPTIIMMRNKIETMIVGLRSSEQDPESLVPVDCGWVQFRNHFHALSSDVTAEGVILRGHFLRLSGVPVGKVAADLVSW